MQFHLLSDTGKFLVNCKEPDGEKNPVLISSFFRTLRDGRWRKSDRTPCALAQKQHKAFHISIF